MKYLKIFPLLLDNWMLFWYLVKTTKIEHLRTVFDGLQAADLKLQELNVTS